MDSVLVLGMKSLCGVLVLEMLGCLMLLGTAQRQAHNNAWLGLALQMAVMTHTHCQGDRTMNPAKSEQDLVGQDRKSPTQQSA
jgi:hypothetical protein